MIGPMGFSACQPEALGFLRLCLGHGGVVRPTKASTAARPQLLPKIWGFPKIGDPNIAPLHSRILIIRTPK